VTTIDVIVRSVLCPTCGCSLARLGLSREQAFHAPHERHLHYFCCEGCADVFRTDPDRYLARIEDVVVCPGCLAEKPLSMTFAIEHEGRTVHFCECPYCLERFERDPAGLLARLEDW
jgi:YHS domain-containing protein